MNKNDNLHKTREENLGNENANTVLPYETSSNTGNNQIVKNDEKAAEKYDEIIDARQNIGGDALIDDRNRETNMQDLNKKKNLQ